MCGPFKYTILKIKSNSLFSFRRIVLDAGKRYSCKNRPELTVEIKKLPFAADNRSLEDTNKTRNGKSKHKLFRNNGYKKFSPKNICGSCNFDAIFINTWAIEIIPLIRIFKLRSVALRAQ